MILRKQEVIKRGPEAAIRISPRYFGFMAIDIDKYYARYGYDQDLR